MNLLISSSSKFNFTSKSFIELHFFKFSFKNFISLILLSISMQLLIKKLNLFSSFQSFSDILPFSIDNFTLSGNFSLSLINSSLKNISLYFLFNILI